MNRYPRWKYILVAVVLLVSIIYALPNVYGEDPAVQILAPTGTEVTPQLIDQISMSLKAEQLNYQSIERESDKTVLVRFTDVPSQFKAQQRLISTLSDDYTVALNLAPATPQWLTMLGAHPMKLGLDLRGGVHFLLSIDVDSLVQRRESGDMRSLGESLRDAQIRYSGLRQQGSQILLQFRNEADLNQAVNLIGQRFPDLQSTPMSGSTPESYGLQVSMTDAARLQAQEYAVEQTITVLRNRINELGIAEPIVQRQGADRVSVDLPGIQDTARARQILGGTATVEMRLVDVNHDAKLAATGTVPAGSRLYTYEGQPLLLEDRVILAGSAITGAVASIDENGQPAVQVRLGGGGESYFYRVTGENVGKPMAIVFVETKTDKKGEDASSTAPTTTHKVERIVSVATIKSALGSGFQVTGLGDPEESRNLALFLRSGDLPTAIDVVAESTLGPSLGQENIHKGIVSIEAGLLLIMLFMLLYYRFFGLIANLALVFNLIVIVAILSILGATLTLPGIAGIVLVLGMAVDANVLIFERIREELRHGMTPHASIEAGYGRALATIVDSNVTTLIAAIALFGLGTGVVKGFAVTLTIGILASMFTAITATRALVNLVYGRRAVKQLSIGIMASPVRIHNDETIER